MLRKPALILALMATTLSAWAQLDPNAVVASVNGDEIKASEYYHRLEWLRIDPQNNLSRLPAGFLAIKELITERLIFQMAKQKGVTPTDDEIAAAEKEEIAQAPTLLTDIKNQGRPETDLTHDIAYNLAQFKLQTYGITITDQQVEQHYHDYPSLYTIPKRFKVKVIVVREDADQAAVDKDLAAGKTFADAATAHSLDVTKAIGGEYGEIPETSLATPAKAALNAVKIGQATAWVTGIRQDDNVKVKYLLEDIKPESLMPLDATLRKQIRRRLMIDKGNARNAVLKDLGFATVQAKVVIHQPEFQRIYDQLVKQMQSSTGG